MATCFKLKSISNIHEEIRGNDDRKFGKIFMKIVSTKENQ